MDQCLLHLLNFNFNVHLQLGGEERRDRGHNMGLGLQRLNRARRGKLQVVITEGHIRPVVPLVAAKFASECNIAVRNHVPVLTHWKKYKKRPAVIDTFLGILCVSTFSKAFLHLPVLNHACILPCCLVNKDTHYFLHMSFHLNRQSSTLTQMMMWLNMVALK